MKKFLLLFFALLSIVFSAQAQTYFEVGGIRYRIWQESWDENPGEVYVAKSSDESSSYTGDINIPASVVYTKTYKVTGIESDAFKECSGLTSVTIPDGVTRIEDRAFQDCTGLTSITIPNSVTWIGGSGTFSGCSKLTSVTLSNQLTTVEWNTFQDCTSLTSIIIPNSVTAIGSSAFRGCSKLGEVTIGDHVKTIDGSAFQDCTSLSSIIIPNSVKEINWSVFSGCTSLTSVEIPNSVKTISGSVFSGCTSLVSVTIPNSVTKIEGSAFSGCTSLTSIEIPTSVTKIENSTFSGCESLSSITIPDGVTKIEGNAFSGCKSLTSIIIPNSVTTIGDNNTGGSAFSNCSKLTSVTLSNQLTSIPAWTFSSCTSLTSITIPSSVTSIGEYAFNGCTSLSSITIPSSVTEIKRGALQGCGALKLVTSEIATPFEVENVFDWSIQYAALVVPKDTRTLYENTEGWKNFAVIFEEGEANHTLERTEEGVKYSLRLAEDNSVYYAVTGYSETLKPEIAILPVLEECPVKAIAENAFNGCSSLTSITIPNSVISIGQSAFWGCSNLRMVKSEIVTPFKVNSFDWYNNNNKVVLVVPQGSRTAYKDQSGWEAYYIYEEGEPIYDVAETKTDDQGLKYRLIQEDNIGSYYAVTGHAEDMKADIVIPADIDGCPVWGIEWSAFQNCTSLTSITFLNDVKKIDENAFYGCINLNDVKVYVWDDAEFCNNHILGRLPNNPINSWDGNNSHEKFYTLHVIKKDNEGNDIEITDYVIPEGVTTIGDGAFKGFVNLSSIVIPNNITSIGSNAFSGCTNLLSVKMGKKVTSIGDYAFYNCSSLESITLPKELESIGNSAFSGDNYYSDEGCNAITSIAIPGTVKTIGNGAFRGCRNLALVVFEVDEDGKANLTSIGEEAFFRCDLTSITLPNSVTTIGKTAFRDNYKLTTAILGDALTEIKDDTFQYCFALSSVTIPDGVTSIGEHAFQGCNVLTSVRIPKSLSSMGENAFDGCPIKSIELPDAFTAITANLFKNNDLEYIKLGNNVKSIGKGAFGSKLDGEEALVLIEINTPTPPTIASDAFSALEDVSVINVIVPDAAAETAYKKAAVWKEMTFANKETVVELSVGTPGDLGYELITELDVTPAKVVSLKVKGAINDKDFDQMRSNMKSLLRLDLSECDITEIPDEAMKDKTQLQELILPAKLQTIGNKAFQGCPYLTGNLDLPSGVISIGDYAFEGTYYTSVTLPVKLQKIGINAFNNLPLKQKLVLPRSLTSIGDGAFADTQVSGYVEIPNGITYLGYGAFRNTQIESAALRDNPNCITSISSGLFQGCTKFKANPLYIPSTYTSVEGYAFDGCTALMNVRLSANLVSIGEYAFQNTQLDYINVPSKVETIGTGAFKNCKSLVMLSLPATLKMVGPEGLRGCSALRNLSVEAIEPPAVDKSSMIGVNTDLCLISIPTESYRSYVTADYWGQFVQMRNDIAVETEGDGEIGFESVDENEEGQEALARARARRISAARAMTRASEEEAELDVAVVGNGSSVYVPKQGKVRFYIIPGAGQKLLSATLDGVDIMPYIVDGVYTTTADKKNAKLVVKFSGSAGTDQPTALIS